MNESIFELYRKFTKGVKYFREKWASGQDSPPVRAQLSIFEREVVNPFDRECSRLSTEERLELENMI